SVPDYDAESYLFFTTKHGISKRTSLSQFENIRKNGLIALHLRDNDELISVQLTDGTKDIMIATQNGSLIRFDEKQIRSMGRVAASVKGMSLREGDEVVSMQIIEDNDYILNVTENGYGKRTEEKEYRITNRGGKGIFTAHITEKTGNIVAVKTVKGDEDLMIMTESGVLIRTPIAHISITGRNTQGVRLIRLEEGDNVATVAYIEQEEKIIEEIEIKEQEEQDKDPEL